MKKGNPPMMYEDKAPSAVAKEVASCKRDVTLRDYPDSMPLVDAPAKKGNADSNTPGWAGQGKRGMK
jgi:hypothetical protein